MGFYGSHDNYKPLVPNDLPTKGLLQTTNRKYSERHMVLRKIQQSSTSSASTSTTTSTS